jgi:hypothetical protein
MLSNKAEDWLDDLETVGDYAAEKIGSTIGQTPVVKAIGQVLANPTPQEVGAQVAGLAKSVSNTLQESFGGDPVDVAINYGPGAVGATVRGVGKLFHGTKEGAVITEFNPQMADRGIGSNAFAQGNKGMYFTEDIGMARYASRKANQSNILRDRSLDAQQANDKSWEYMFGSKKDIGENIIAADLKPNARILDVDYYPNKEQVDEIISSGKYDGIRFPELGIQYAEDVPKDLIGEISKNPKTVFVFNTDAIRFPKAEEFLDK